MDEDFNIKLIKKRNDEVHVVAFSFLFKFP